MRAFHAAGLLILLAPVTGAAAQSDLAIFVFDQTTDTLLRMVDGNDDGDALDPGETTVFYSDAPGAMLGLDNSQGLFAVSQWEMRATDNFAPDNILSILDVNQDGDGLDVEDEVVVWHDGALPGGFTLTNPVCLSPGPGPASYMIDNNTLDQDNPEAVYRLEDLNDDGDVNDPGEVTLYFQLAPVGVSAATTFDIEFDAAGAGYVVDITDPNQIESIDRIAPDASTITEWVDSTDLLLLIGLLIGGGFELDYIPDTDELLISLVDGGSRTHIVALRDNDGSGRIDVASEARILWDEAVQVDGISVGTPRDLCYVPADGSIVFTEALNDQVVRLFDRNNDGDYNDANESMIVYDSKIAEANGLPRAPLMLSCAVAVIAPRLPGDMNCDGTVSVGDINPFVLALTDPDAYATMFPDCDIQNGDCSDDGMISVGDINCFVALVTGG